MSGRFLTAYAPLRIRSRSRTRSSAGPASFAIRFSPAVALSFLPQQLRPTHPQATCKARTRLRDSSVLKDRSDSPIRAFPVRPLAPTNLQTVLGEFSSRLTTRPFALQQGDSDDENPVARVSKSRPSLIHQEKMEFQQT